MVRSCHLQKHPRWCVDLNDRILGACYCHGVAVENKIVPEYHDAYNAGQELVRAQALAIREACAIACTIMPNEH